MSRSILVLVLACAVALAGCTQQKTDTPPGRTTDDGGANGGSGTPTWEASFVATDYAFSGPSTMYAGWNEVTLQNDGRELHHLLFMRFNDSAGAGAFRNAMMGYANASGADGEMPMGNMSMHADPTGIFGGPNAVHPGMRETAWVELEEGTYNIVCWIPAPDGSAHAVNGMMRQVTVLAAAGGPSPPTPDVNVTLDDYEFRADRNLTAGTHLVKFTNAGEHHHEAAIIRLDENKTAMDFIGYFDPANNATGPPPARGAGGINSIEAGDVSYARLTLEPGRYAFICFETNDEDAPPHFALGMVWEFTVS